MCIPALGQQQAELSPCFGKLSPPFPHRLPSVQAGPASNQPRRSAAPGPSPTPGLCPEVPRPPPGSVRGERAGTAGQSRQRHLVAAATARGRDAILPLLRSLAPGAACLRAIGQEMVAGGGPSPAAADGVAIHSVCSAPLPRVQPPPPASRRPRAEAQTWRTFGFCCLGDRATPRPALPYPLCPPPAGSVLSHSRTEHTSGFAFFLFFFFLRRGKGKDYSLLVTLYSFRKAVFYPLFSPFPHVSLPSWIAVPAYIGCLGLEGIILFFLSFSFFLFFLFLPNSQDLGLRRKKNPIKTNVME